MASNVTVRLIGDASHLQRTFGTVERDTRSFGKKTLGILKGAGGAAAAAGIVQFGRTSVTAFKDAEDAQNRLAEAFRKSPKLADANIGAFQDLNAELSKKTKFDDDATASGQAVLAGFGLTADELKTLTPLLQDYAAKTGKDMPSAAKDLGKAVLGQGRALKNIGVDFKDTGDKTQNLQQLVGGLRKQVGGFAKAEGQTAAGKAAILSNQFGELQEKVGSKLVPALSKLADIGLKVIDFIDRMNGPTKAAIGTVAGLAVAVLAINKAAAMWRATQAALNVVLAANPYILVAAAIAGLVVVVVKNWDTIVAATKVAWEWIKGAVSAVADFLVDLFLNWTIAGQIVKHWDAIKEAASTAWNFVKDTVTGVATTVADFFLNWTLAGRVIKHWDDIKTAATDTKDWVVGKFNDLVDFFEDLPGNIFEFLKDLPEDLLNFGKEMADKVIEGIGNLPQRIAAKLNPFGTSGPGVDPEVWRELEKDLGLDGKAMGGPVSAFKPYIVGERGPELFMPKSSGTIVPNHQIGGHTFVINGYQRSPRQLAGDILWQLGRV